MFRYCSQFKLKMNPQTNTTLNGNFDGNEKTSMKVLKYPGIVKAELIRRLLLYTERII